MKYTKAILIAGLSLAVCFSGCRTSEKQNETADPTVTETPTETATPTETETPAETTAEEPIVTPEGGPMQIIPVSKEVTSSDGLYRIKIPETWEDMQDQLDAPYTIEVGSMDESAFMVVTGENKEGNILTSLDEYMSTLVGYVSGKLSDVQIDSRSQSQVDNKASYKQKMIGTVDGVSTAYFVYTIDGTTQYIQLNGWAPADKADRAELFFDQIVNSYREAGEE